MKAVLAGIALLLGGVLVMQWKDWPPSPPAPPPPLAADAAAQPENPAVPAGDDFTLSPSREEYAAVTERPLFLPERRPPPDVPETEDELGPDEATELDGTDLAAVVITPQLVAGWVRSPDSQELVKLRLGEPFQGWTVKTIEPHRMVFERQGETDELELLDFQNAPVAATPRPGMPMRRMPPNARQPGLPRRVPVAEFEPPEPPEEDYNH